MTADSNSDPSSLVLETPVKQRRSISWKRILFSGVTLLIVLGILELTSWGMWLLFPPFRLVDFQHTLDNIAKIGTERANDLEVIHPYLGWAFNPDAAHVPAHAKGQLTVNSLGFVDTAPSVQHRRTDRFVVGIFGGSVAQQMGTIGEQAFKDRLAMCPALKGREIHLVRLAMSGYKQPQQLMALNYIMVLGGEFDAVINIDGYNETSLVVGENNLRVFAAYPRAWYARLQDVVDPRNASTSYRLLGIRATRQARAQFMAGSFLRRTWTGSFLWATLDEMLSNQQLNLGLELMNSTKKRGLGFARQGPEQVYSNDEGMYEHITEIWRNSSTQMHYLCRAKGIPYFHFLQPNQYHTGSKPLSPLEREKFYSPNQEHAMAITIGYPKLIAEGAKLREQGIAFHDVTQLFAQETDTIYSDYFCHYNARGTRMLAEAVAATVAEALPSP